LAVDSPQQQVLPSERSGDHPATIAQTVVDVSEKVAILVREEIELAKIEVTEKVTKLIKGIVVGLAAGVFAVFGVMFLMHGFAWLAWYEIFPGNTFFWGFFVIAALLFLMGALAGYLAFRAVRAGTPPTPAMAIDEARRIRETVQSPEPRKTI
jgi:uncharacterized membrane protein YqjE